MAIANDALPHMHWPWSNSQPVVGLSASRFGPADPLVVARPSVEAPLADAFRQRENIVVYGPPRQGKTTFLARALPAEDPIYIECRPGFKRAQIYRVLLAALGYAIVVTKKRRGKATATVKLGLLGVGVEAGAEGEVEQEAQAVTVDLKNPSEVAHLIARIGRVPYLVLNNFQLLDGGTKRSLLFDLAFFAERSRVRFVIVGAWLNEDYIEEIEPALGGRLRYVPVPLWSDDELRAALDVWKQRFPALASPTTPVDALLALSDGDISLLRAMLDDAVLRASGKPASSATADLIAATGALVASRFGRSLGPKLRDLLAERDAYIGYAIVNVTRAYEPNPRFSLPDDDAGSPSRRTAINPETGRPYADGRVVQLDAAGEPQYEERLQGELGNARVGIVPFMLLQMHDAVAHGERRVLLDDLVRELLSQLRPPVAALNEVRLRSVFSNLVEIQRRALIVPPLLAVDTVAPAIEIADRRFELFLRSIAREDLEDLLDEAQPSTPPQPRRRHQVSDTLTEAETQALIARAVAAERETAAAPEPRANSAEERPLERPRRREPRTHQRSREQRSGPPPSPASSSS